LQETGGNVHFGHGFPVDAEVENAGLADDHVVGISTEKSKNILLAGLLRIHTHEATAVQRSE
jgi:hypothetical protein